MTEEKKYRNLLINNKELAANFMNESLGIKWIAAIVRYVAIWVNSNGKACWEIVRFVSLREGFIKDKVKRNVFSEMVFTFCREALSNDETAKKIRESMEKSKYKNELKDFEHLSDSNLTRGLADEVREMLKMVVVDEESSVAPTIASRLEDYLRATVKEDTTVMPCSRIRMSPDYGNDMTPSLSIEQYVNKTFLAKKEPSHIDAYECISSELEKDALRAYIQKYADKKNLKLFLVGQYGLRNDVYELAREKSIGYVFINPRHEMDSDSYLLPRSVGDANSLRKYREMLMGRKPMQVPLLVWDGYRVTSSLAESLQAHQIPIKDSYLLKAPVLPYKEIEAKADELTHDHVKTVISRFPMQFQQLFDKEGLSLPFDVIREVQRVGLKYEYVELPEGQLGCMSLKEQKILLNQEEADNTPRSRFTMAHEYGHYVLHSELLKSQGIDSFGDSEDTITELLSVKEQERKWLERHANHFAACLLMPQKIVFPLFSVLHKYFVQDVYGDKWGPIYYHEDQRETFDTYNNVVGNMAKLLNVSKQAMTLRLQSLKLMNKTQTSSHVLFSFNN